MTRYVLLAGEGKNELGGWFDEPQYRGSDPKPGVLEALLRKVQADGWEIRESLSWKSLPRYRTGDRLSKEELNTQALWVYAREKNCDVIVFSRDRDGDRARQESIERGLEWLDQQASATGVRVVGAVAVECLEAWLLAITGASRTEEMGRRKVQKRWSETLQASSTDAMVEHTRSADLNQIPSDARSLRDWIARARTALSEPG